MQALDPALDLPAPRLEAYRTPALCCTRTTSQRAGVELFRIVCDQDLEGVVAKRRDGLYTPEATTWVKIKNPRYSQAEGRRELFERRRAAGVWQCGSKLGEEK